MSINEIIIRLRVRRFLSMLYFSEAKYLFGASRMPSKFHSVAPGLRSDTNKRFDVGSQYFLGDLAERPNKGKFQGLGL